MAGTGEVISDHYKYTCTFIYTFSQFPFFTHLHVGSKYIQHTHIQPCIVARSIVGLDVVGSLPNLQSQAVVHVQALDLGIKHSATVQQVNNAPWLTGLRYMFIQCHVNHTVGTQCHGDPHLYVQHTRICIHWLGPTLSPFMSVCAYILYTYSGMEKKGQSL